MKYLKYFEDLNQTGVPKPEKSKPMVEPNRIYEVDWKEFAPKSLVLIKGDITDMNGYLLDQKTHKPTNQLCKYKQANIMADLVMQVTYERDFDVLGIPDTLEFDMTILNPDSQDFEMSVEITFGDMIASGFEIKRPNQFKIHQYTSFHSKADPSNTVFGFTETSLNKLIKFFNYFDGLRVTRADLNFLDNNKFSYRPS
jgi:hypothetical protein